MFLGKTLRDTGSFNVTTRERAFSLSRQTTRLRAEQSSFLSQNIAKRRNHVRRFLHPPSGLPLDSHDLEENLYSCAFVKDTKRKKCTLRATRDYQTYCKGHPSPLLRVLALPATKGFLDLKQRSPFAAAVTDKSHGVAPCL